MPAHAALLDLVARFRAQLSDYKRDLKDFDWVSIPPSAQHAR